MNTTVEIGDGRLTRPTMWRMPGHLWALPLVIGCAIGCGDTTGLGPAGVDGTWNYYVSTFVGGGFECLPTVSPLATMSLRQETSTTFGGSYDAGGFTCRRDGSERDGGTRGPGEIFDGRLYGSNVMFRFTIGGPTSTGIVSRGGMSGTAFLVLLRENGQDTVAGTWHAERVAAGTGAAR